MEEWIEANNKYMECLWNLFEKTNSVRARFELAVPFPTRWFSRPVHYDRSATSPKLC